MTASLAVTFFYLMDGGEVVYGGDLYFMISN